MASEYYKKKFQDVKPDVKVELTKKEKWKNWWTYHWFYVLVSVAAVLFVCLLLSEWVFKTRPDYRVAYIGQYYMMADTDDVADGLEEFGKDLNGDKKVVVRLKAYSVHENNPNYESDMVALTGDIGVGDSKIYIVDDAQWFIGRYGVATEEYCYQISQCPMLADLGLNGDYSILLRVEEGETISSDVMAFWQALTAGAQ